VRGYPSDPRASSHVPLSPVGSAPLRSGFVENIHTNGPIVFAHEQYVLNGASPNATYTVAIHVSLESDTTCSAPIVSLDTATLTTNVSGNGSAFHVFRPADIDGLANSTIHAYWTVSAGGSVVYQTACQTIMVDS
jgi:hypothetical protein